MNTVQDAPYKREARPEPLDEIYKRTTENNIDNLRGARAQGPSAGARIAKAQPLRDGNELLTEVSQLDKSQENNMQKERSSLPTGEVIGDPRAETEAVMRARIMKEVEDRSWATEMSTKDAPSPNELDLKGLRDQLGAEMRQEVEMEFQRQQDLQTTYNQTYEKSYADLKRREAEEQQFIDRIKEQAKSELRQEQEATEKRAREEQDLRDRVRRIAEVEREQIEAQQQARQHQRPADDFMQQFKDHSKDTVSEINEPDMIRNAIQRYTFPHVEYDVMSYVTEETETTSVSSSGESISNSSSDNEDDSDETETVKTTIGSQDQGETRNVDVERSQPWKGPAHLGNFIELTPFYLRGSDAGQTWYHGHEAIYIIEFQAGYNGETATNTDEKAHKGPYLLVSKLWVDPEALDRFGFKYTEGPPSHFFLDPTLSWESIEVLVNFTYALREIETFKTHGQGQSNHARLLCRSPPALDFFTAGSSREASAPTLVGQTSAEDAPEEGEHAEEKPWSLIDRLAYPLSVLNFALHTIT
ncbi:hypothetical protein Daus18300_010380 [Diaporthe australafricana]|uniref:Uncharacterized protein n=1 Tax=Diaporthe australafricana TaxID=127596 RepID=A0ABR3WAE3_9PEZI